MGRGIQNDCALWDPSVMDLDNDNACQRFDYPRDHTLGRQLTMVRFGLYKIYPNVKKIKVGRVS